MSDRETQIRGIFKILAPWPGAVSGWDAASALYAAGYRDFDAELRRRLDALPDSEFVALINELGRWWYATGGALICRQKVHTALTAPEPAGEWFRYRKPDEPSAMATPAPERRWVVQRKSDGAFRDVPTAWTMSLEAATKMLSRIDALEVALLMPEICLIRAVVRQPGARQFQQCPDAERTGGYWTIGQAGAGLPVRELPAPDGPWTLVEAP